MTINLKMFQHFIKKFQQFSEMFVSSTFYQHFTKCCNIFLEILDNIFYNFFHLPKAGARQPPARRPARGKPPRPTGSGATATGPRRPVAPSLARCSQAASMVDECEHAAWRPAVIAHGGERPNGWERTEDAWCAEGAPPR
jgi:hypothetical protein